MQVFYYAAEDAVSRALADRLLLHVFPKTALQSISPDRGGNSVLMRKFPSYCDLSRHYPVLVVTDLDHFPCPPSLRDFWFQRTKIDHLPDCLIFSVACREAEAWVLGDSDGVANLLGLRKGRISSEPELYLDPKKEIVALAHEGRRRRNELCPLGSAKVGPGYNRIICGFVEKDWDILAASRVCPSLQRAVTRLTELKESMPCHP